MTMKIIFLIRVLIIINAIYINRWMIVKMRIILMIGYMTVIIMMMANRRERGGRCW